MTNPLILDLRGVPCPLSFVRAKLRLERVETGESLQIWLDGGEPIEQVPNSLSMDGHQISEVTPNQDFFVLTVVKA
jgi:TusA-related sulfurtransferase